MFSERIHVALRESTTARPNMASTDGVKANPSNAEIHDLTENADVESKILSAHKECLTGVHAPDTRAPAGIDHGLDSRFRLRPGNSLYN